MNNDKKLYWLIESNGDLSVTCNNLQQCQELLKEDFDSLDVTEQMESQYTITPMWYTDEEKENLPDAE